MCGTPSERPTERADLSNGRERRLCFFDDVLVRGLIDFAVHDSLPLDLSRTAEPKGACPEFDRACDGFKGIQLLRRPFDALRRDADVAGDLLNGSERHPLFGGVGQLLVGRLPHDLLYLAVAVAPHRVLLRAERE
jgi:hypothetical protein